VFHIEEGAVLRERQKILSVLDLSTPLYVDTEIPESEIARVMPGQKARIKVDAFPDETLNGVVERVFPMASPGKTSYLTRILIDHGSTKLRPGMTAGFEILVGE
jgi:multidrug resistance efflux pump